VILTIQARNLTITIERDGKTIVENFSFTVPDGAKAALIGEEGNGKSTLLKWLYDPKLVEGYASVTGDAFVSGTKGYLSQELRESDRSLSVSEYLCTYCGGESMDPKALSRALKDVNLPYELAYSDQKMGTLSGGERVKLALAVLLLNDCDVLFLDEPTNDLDLETLQWLERFLASVKKTVLYVSHDETLLSRTAEAVIHLELVRRKKIPRATAANLPYETYMQRRDAAMQHQAQVAQFEQKAFREKKERYLSIYNAVDRAQASVSRQDPSAGRLLKKKMHTVTSIGKRLEKEQQNLTEAPEAEWAILPKWLGGEVKNGRTVLEYGPAALSLGERVLSENVRLRITGPERVCIVGRNGCGKTTLLKALVPEIEKRGFNTFYMPQTYADLLPTDRLPVEFLAPDGDKESVTEARIFLGSMKVTTDEMSHPIRSLSGGQQAKLLLLKAILGRADVLVLDEPTRNLSPLSAPAVRTLLREFRGAILFVSHDRKLIREVATRTLALSEAGLSPFDAAAL
jgi:ATPase subunit of ABC transporter with duplicated ATPase domains